MKNLENINKVVTALQIFKYFMIAVLLLLAAGFSALLVTAQSPPILDGRLDSLYLSHGLAIDYESFYAEANATLYVIDNPGIDSDYIWLAWVINKSFIDNSYGANKHSSWPKGHSFNDLLESDKQRMDLENRCGETVLDATMDYIDGPPNHAAYSTISGYNVDMNSTESVKTFINGGDWSKMSFSTSLVANLNDFGYCSAAGDCNDLGTDLLTDSPPWSNQPAYQPIAVYNAWQYTLIYELRVHRSVFVTPNCPNGGILGIATNPVELHASPSKIGVNSLTMTRIAASIGDYIWHDADRDGIQDVSESGIANVTAALYSDPNGDGDPSDGFLIAATTTDSNGKYIFNNLGSADYVVDVTDTNGVLTHFSLTAGSTDPYGSIQLDKGENYLNADFGYALANTTTGAIGDFIWSDANNNGMQDQGEPGIGGVTLQLLADYDGDGNFTDVVAVTTTADDGSYLFTGLVPGYYKVDVTDTAGVLAGYSLSTGPQSSLDPTAAIGVTGGSLYINADFGYYRPGLGTIGNLVWIETDGDGIYEPADTNEQPIDNVTVALIQDTNGNGTWDTGEMVIATTTTINGMYQFTGLPLDNGSGNTNYLVHVTDIHDELGLYRKSLGPNPGADNNSQADFYHVQLSPASPSNQTADFGYYLDKSGGLVGDRVWYDLDGDGNQDTGEPGISGVKVELWKMKNGVPDKLLGSMTSNDGGNYFFPNLDVGSNDNNGPQYAVIVSAANFLPGGVLDGYIATNQPDNQDESVPLTASVNEDLTLDFGYRQMAMGDYSIGDTVWHDSDGDGLLDPLESGFENVTIVLFEDTDGDGVLDNGEPIIAQDVTDAGGHYLFTGLDRGDYIVRITDENGILRGYTQTYGSQRQPVALSGDDMTVDFGFNLEPPTYDLISSFEVYSDSGGTVVHWETSLENGTVGFNLFRSDIETGSGTVMGRSTATGASTGMVAGTKPGTGTRIYQQVNDKLLPALPATPTGGIYRYRDDGAFPGAAYAYKLEEIEVSGKKNVYGPFLVTVNHGRVNHDQSPLPTLQERYAGIPHSITAQRQERMQAYRSYLGQLASAGTLPPTVQKLTGTRELKIKTISEGLYFLGAEQIAGATGLSLNDVVNQVGQQKFRLYNRDREVTWFPADNNAGLYFYGESINSIYTRENVYRLKHESGQPAKYADGGSPAHQTGNDGFVDTLHFEIDRYPLTALFNDPHDDFWLWDFIRAGSTGKTFTLNVPAVNTQEQAELKVTLKGSSNSPANLDHHAVVKFNGTFIGEGRWDGEEKYHLRIPVDHSLLIDGPNVVEVSGILAGGVPFSIFYVDSFDLTYHRYYRAQNGQAIVSGQGNHVITIEGFTDPGIKVFDISVPADPQLLVGVTIDDAGSPGNYRVSFLPASAGSRYLAVSSAGITLPYRVLPGDHARLRYKTNSAEYIIIYPAGLEAGAARLAGLRQAHGLETMTVLIDDIYDEFNYGIANPHAMKDFLAFAYTEWLGNIPRYVVLLGEGNYDYKNVTGYGDNLLPPLMEASPHGLFASDTILGDAVGNDGVPEIATGRIPVLTPAELAAYLDKLENYAGSGGDWTGRVVMLADNPDQAGNFPADSNDLATLFSQYSVTKIYLPDFSLVVDARSSVLQAINNGAVLVSYIGHGGLRNLAQEGMLRNEDLPLLDNLDRLPIFAAMTCGVGRFEVPGFDTLSELLVLKGDGGAIVMLSPTGLSFNSQARVLAHEFFKAAFVGSKTTAGDAVRQAMAAFYAQGGASFMLHIYNILGDPAVEIK